MEEIWKPIPGYETHYAASSLGRVKSLHRVVEDFRNGKKRSRIFKERILQFNVSKAHKRISVMLSKDGKVKRILVSRLVCLAFHGLPPKDKENVLHYDDVHTNNVPANLRWGSLKENAADMRRNLGYWPSYIDGRSKRPRKKIGDPLLNEAQVRVLKRIPDMRHMRGLRTALAEAWGVKPSTITSTRDESKGWKDLATEPLWDMAERLNGSLLGREKLKRTLSMH